MTSHFLNKIPNHAAHKQRLLKLIKNIPLNRYNNISHTDWNLPQRIKKEWQHYFLKNIYIPWCETFSKQSNQNVVLHNCWFQWYEREDYHDWHIHNNTHFTNVYYLQLPNNKVRTSIFAMGKEINIDVNEGDILTFPAYWQHCSPKNNYDAPKVIISFNVDLQV